MRWRKNWYPVHRWLGLVVGLQLLAWSVGGFLFSVLDNVHGDLERAIPPSSPLRAERVRVLPGDAIRAASANGIEPERVAEVLCRERTGRLVDELLDARRRPLGPADGLGRVLADPVVTAGLSETILSLNHRDRTLCHRTEWATRRTVRMP